MSTTTERESTEYTAAAMAFSEAEWRLREAGVAEIRRLMPAEVQAVVFRINDTPRLAVSRVIIEPDAMGDEMFMETPAGEAIDDVAAEIRVTNADEADGFLDQYTEGDGRLSEWIIKREVGQ